VKPKKPPPDRDGEWDRCQRCGYPAQITRAVAYGGFLKYQPADGLVVCWNGRECSLRLRRRRSKEARP
jgi:hypothetical protein